MMTLPVKQVQVPLTLDIALLMTPWIALLIALLIQLTPKTKEVWKYATAQKEHEHECGTLMCRGASLASDNIEEPFRVTIAVMKVPPWIALLIALLIVHLIELIIAVLHSLPSLVLNSLTKYSHSLFLIQLTLWRLLIVVLAMLILLFSLQLFDILVVLPGPTRSLLTCSAVQPV